MKKIEPITTASNFTIEINQRFAKKIDSIDDFSDFNDANRGFIEGLELPEEIKNEDGITSYSMKAWDFLKNKEVPDTVNPSLWRQSRLNSQPYGLFEVIKGHIYQVRGFDIANMSFVKGKKGWIVIDVLGTKEVAAAGLKLFKEYIKEEDFKIAAIIITHPHADHYGGIGAFDEYNVLKIIGPKGFMEHAINENLMAGRAMHRRARYMYGMLIEKGSTSSVGSGLGQTNSVGEQNLRPITIEIENDAIWLEDKIGLQIEFVYVTETEAPSEIMLYIRQYRAFCVAEEINRNMHNLITLRGAKVRNGLIWSKAIDKVIEKYAENTVVSFSTHHWPTWDKENIKQYWEDQRDMYRYLHDRTLNLINRGYTPLEIAENINLPDGLKNKFYNREYYGTISHNVKAQYQMHLGWFDGNPANLNSLPPTEAGEKYVKAIGGAKAMIKIAKDAYEYGDYRWAAMLLNHLVFAEPNNTDARLLLANVYTQLGYQSESGPWRNFYLTAAAELKEKPKEAMQDLRIDEIINLNTEQLFDFMAINLTMEESKNLEIYLFFTDTSEYCTLLLRNGALTSRVRDESDNISGIRSTTLKDFKQNLVNYKKFEGDSQLMSLFEVLDFTTNRNFNIIEP